MKANTPWTYCNNMVCDKDGNFIAEAAGPATAEYIVKTINAYNRAKSISNKKRYGIKTTRKRAKKSI